MTIIPRFTATLLTPVFVLGLALCLSACKPEAEKQAAQTSVEETVAATVETPQAAAPAEAPAVMPVPADIPAFLAALQAAIASDNRAAVAAMVRYPLTTYNNGVATAEYADAGALLAVYDALFTPAVQAAIRSATPETLFTNADGVMIGNGEIWIDDSLTPPMIKSINAEPQN